MKFLTRRTNQTFNSTRTRVRVMGWLALALMSIGAVFFAQQARAVTLTEAGASYGVSINENTTSVGTFTAGAGATGGVTISGGIDAARFTLVGSSLEFAVAPDFETALDGGADNTYIVTLNDGTNFSTITVTIVNVTEITSDLGGATAAVNAAENQNSVTDVDANGVGAPGGISYQIFGGADAAKFSINASTGVLTFLANPNFEVPTDLGDTAGNNTYVVVVQASSSSGSTDTQTITVTVTNVNENPVITSNGGGATAAVNAAENQTAVTTVTSTDADGNLVTYTITGGDDAAAFGIVGGVLTFNVAPNFEVPTDLGDTAGNNTYVVEVTATDNGAGSLTDVQTITVTVTNVNEAPIITSDGGGATAAVNAAENQTAVTTVTSTDVDAGSVRTYSITGGADAAKFDIVGATGVLTFKVAPNFEVPTDLGDTAGNNTYVVEVTATDNLLPSLTDVQTITVTVTDDDEAIVITSNGGGATAAVNAAENQTAVTTVVAADGDNLAVTYTITGGDDAAAFGIVGGVLTFNVAPNFEVPTDLGDTAGNNTYVVEVTATSGDADFDVQTITVTVTNVNEAPIITSDGGGATAAVNAAENQTAVTTVTSTDVDAGSVRTYSITGGADAAKFDIVGATGVLTFKVAPNFEVPTDLGDTAGNNTYVVEVTATDNLLPSLTDVQTITVTVTDANDAPVITSNGGGATAAVNAAENQTAVTTVTSTDADGNLVTYTITGGADAAAFGIVGGVLTFNVAPNFEVPTDLGDTAGNNTYVVEVTATDNGAGSLTDVQTITVTVTDANDAPVITSNGGGATAAVNAAENQTAVTTVTSTDADGNLVTYTITGGADAAKFGIVGGVLTFNVAPNFEVPTDLGDTAGNNTYVVEVTATDNGAGSLTDVQTITVTVTDVNDAPVITSNGGGATAAVNAAENQTAVTTVTSTDADGNLVTYTITGGADAAKFGIVGGVLTFNVAPNFEVPTDLGDTAGNNTYVVEVTATDNGAGSLTDVQTITVTVTDVNEAPTVVSGTAFTMAENTAQVTDVNSTDIDTEAATGTGTHIYSISGGADQALFTINATSGVLRFIAAPNFEVSTDAGSDNVYNVQVQVQDLNGAGLIDTEDIVVTVINVNENPVINTPDTSSAYAVPARAEGTNNAATTVQASDVDTGDVISYALAGGADAALFSINAGTGVLTFLAIPDFETPLDAGANNVYEVIVRANDSFGGFDEISLTITVTDINENNAPVITSNGGAGAAGVSIAENTTAVTTVTATDVDPGSVLTYSIRTVIQNAASVDDTFFAINAATGVLTITSRDFETRQDTGANNTYVVVVRVSDGANNVEQTITVTITDVNEATPVITSDGGDVSAAISMNENQTAVTSVIATDADGTAALTYSIIGGADAALFSINAGTGVLTITSRNFESPADTDSNNTYIVDVRVSDGTNTDQQTLTVSIVDVNESTPVITSNGGGAAAGVSIAENTTAVTTVTATDADGSAALTYSLNGGADAASFTIGAATGVLTLNAAANYEAKTSYVVVVRVSDGPNTDDQTITVTITDINEATPVITSNLGGVSAAVSINENTTAVTIVTATDADGTAALTYSIVGGADAALFSIDAGTGVLTISSRNYESPADDGSNNTYIVDVRVSDGTNTDQQTIVLTVNPVDEFNPTFAGGLDVTETIAENGSAVKVADDYAATELDNYPGKTFTYAKKGNGDDTRFTLVDNANGTFDLTFNASADRETWCGGDGICVVTIVATEGDGVGTAELTFTITVTNVDEFNPSFGALVTAQTTAENAAALSMAAAYFATDADSYDGAAKITYAKKGDGDDARFALTDLGNGTFNLSLNASADRETWCGGDGTCVVTIVATEGDGAATAELTFTATITDVNDVTPVISSAAAFNVAENSTAVATVTATDGDSTAPFNTITYSKTGGGADEAFFTINAATGVLTITSRDYETPADNGTNNTYVVVVRASDGTLFVDQTITVTITDVNENASGGGGGGGAPAVQAPVVLAAPATTLDKGGTLALTTTGGSGIGAVTYTTSTPTICSVSATGVVTAITTGSCVVTSTKAADGPYPATNSNTVTITITDSAAAAAAAKAEAEAKAKAEAEAKAKAEAEAKAKAEAEAKAKAEAEAKAKAEAEAKAKAEAEAKAKAEAEAKAKAEAEAKAKAEAEAKAKAEAEAKAKAEAEARKISVGTRSAGRTPVKVNLASSFAGKRANLYVNGQFAGFMTLNASGNATFQVTRTIPKGAVLTVQVSGKVVAKITR